VGTITGVGRIYRQTLIDAYGRVATPKVHSEETVCRPSAIMGHIGV